MPHKDPAAAKASKHAYYLAHKAEWKERTRAWKESNREKVNAAERQRLSNPKAKAKHAKAVKRWSEANPEKKRETAQIGGSNRRARQVQAPGGNISKEQWRGRVEEFGGRCAYCARMVPLGQEHIDPLSRGGAHDLSNVVPACGRCNASKRNRSFLLWLVSRPACLRS